jgi:hypothetical protein
MGANLDEVLAGARQLPPDQQRELARRLAREDRPPAQSDWIPVVPKFIGRAEPRDRSPGTGSSHTGPGSRPSPESWMRRAPLTRSSFWSKHVTHPRSRAFDRRSGHGTLLRLRCGGSAREKSAYVIPCVRHDRDCAPSDAIRAEGNSGPALARADAGRLLGRVEGRSVWRRGARHRLRLAAGALRRRAAAAPHARRARPPRGRARRRLGSLRPATHLLRDDDAGEGTCRSPQFLAARPAAAGSFPRRGFRRGLLKCGGAARRRSPAAVRLRVPADRRPRGAAFRRDVLIRK